MYLHIYICCSIIVGFNLVLDEFWKIFFWEQLQFWSWETSWRAISGKLFFPGTILVLYNSNFPSDYRMGKEVMRSVNEFNNAFLHSEVKSCTLCKAFGLFSIKVSMLDKILIQIVEKRITAVLPRAQTGVWFLRTS